MNLKDIYKVCDKLNSLEQIMSHESKTRLKGFSVIEIIVTKFTYVVSDKWNNNNKKKNMSNSYEHYKSEEEFKKRPCFQELAKWGCQKFFSHLFCHKEDRLG